MTSDTCAPGIAKICATSGDLGEVGRVETQGLAGARSAPFDLTLPSAQESCFYRVLADADNDEPETDESNNTADTASFGPL